MAKDKRTVKKTIIRVVNGSLSRADAADRLGVSLRTVHNYTKRFLARGLDGLVDRRHGHFRKIEPQQEFTIVTCKLDHPDRSSRWIRDRLQLSVSAEAVRRVLLKRFGCKSSQLLKGSLDKANKWDPF